MDQKTDREKVSDLYRAGFTTREIKRLRAVRRMCVENIEDQASMNISHLQFIRWLVENGRLTDQCSESDVTRRGEI